MTFDEGAAGRAARRGRLALAGSMIAVLLAGCGGGAGGALDAGPMGSGNADGQGNFGSTMETTTVARTSPNTPASGSGTPVTGAIDPSDYGCPKVEVRGGAAAWQVQDKSDNALRYQSTLGQFSRECKINASEMTVRVGIQGRVLMGAKGTAGSLNVPLRLAVVEEGPTPKPVWTKLYTVPVTIGAEVMQVDFSMVAEDVTFPLPQPGTLDRYVIYVGFDTQAAAEAEAKQKPRAPAKPRPVATSRPKPAAPPVSTPVAAKPQAPRMITVSPDGTTSAPPPARSAAPPPSASDQQWIGAPAPSAGGFATPTQ